MLDYPSAGTCVPSTHEPRPLSSLEPAPSSAINTSDGTDTVFMVPAAGEKLIQRRLKSRRRTIQPCLTLPPPPPPPPGSPKSPTPLTPVQPISTVEGDHVQHVHVSCHQWRNDSSPAVSEAGGQKTGDSLRRTGSRESIDESHLSSFTPLVTKTRHYARLSSSAQLKRLQNTGHQGTTSRNSHTHRSRIHQLKMTEFVQRSLASPKQVQPAKQNKGTCTYMYFGIDTSTAYNTHVSTLLYMYMHFHCVFLHRELASWWW